MGQFLVFKLQGDPRLEGLSITTSKSIPDDLLEKSSTANICIKFANYWRGIFSFIKFGFSRIKLEWCSVDLKLIFPC